MSSTYRDDFYVKMLLGPLEKSADYLPKMGKSGYALVQFFERSTVRLRSGTEAILKALLEAK